MYQSVTEHVCENIVCKGVSGDLQPHVNYHFNPILITDYRLQFIYEPIIWGANLKKYKNM